MKADVEKYKHEVFGEIRAIFHEGKEYFVAKDVAKALGYENQSRDVQRHCKGSTVLVLPSSGGEQATLVIPESDVYRLVMRSKMAEAERFQDWVCAEVLPSLRKSGQYVSSGASLGHFEALGMTLDRLRYKALYPAQIYKMLELMIKGVSSRDIGVILGVEYHNLYGYKARVKDLLPKLDVEKLIFLGDRSLLEAKTIEESGK